MRKNSKWFHFLIIIGLALLAFKPLLPSTDSKKVLHSVHYSTTNSECPSRTSGVTYCQIAAFYTLGESEIQTTPYLFLFAGVLFFFLTPLVSNSPVSRLFKPPINLR